MWWLLLGPATALCFYEPAYVAIQQAFEPERRARAIAAHAGRRVVGPMFTPATGALVDALGWRDATRVLAARRLRGAGRTRVGEDPSGAGSAGSVGGCDLAPFRGPRLLVFTVAAVLAYGAVEAIVIHRVARFEELGFASGRWRCGPASRGC